MHCRYAVISFEKCTGMGAGVKTEDAIYSEAIRLKKLDPTKKIFFYFATDQQGIDCYNAGEEYKVRERQTCAELLCMKAEQGKGVHNIDDEEETAIRMIILLRLTID